MNDAGALDLIVRSWLLRMRSARSDLDVRLVIFRMACDLMVVYAIKHAQRRAFIAARVNDLLRFLMLATQAANLLLLGMTVTGLARPWPEMQVALATGVMAAIGLDLLWTWRWLDKVLGE